MLTVRVAGVWLRTVGPFAGLEFTHEWPHGSSEAKWSMPEDTTDPKLRGGSLVEIFDGGMRIWLGSLNQPGTTGEFVASGAWTEARGVYALDGSGNATNTPDTAIDQAISRGAVSWTRPASLSAAAWGTPGEPMELDRLLDEAMAGLGKRWYVDADGAVRATTDPTTPTYHVPQGVAGNGLTLAEDAYFSHLIGRFIVSGGTFQTVTVGNADAAARWGRKEGLVDLTPMGVITAPTATTQLTNRLALSGARMGYAEGLELGHGQITTPGGVPVALTMPRAGEMVRLMGVTDETWPTGALPVTDIVIAKSTYREGSGVVQLEPMGLPPRTLTDVLGAA